MSDSIPAPDGEVTDPSERRKPISRSLRFQVLRRDNHTCRYCGATAPDAKITVDHVVPVALGGTDTADNLVAACSDCNAGKAATPADAAVVADVAQDALRWKAAREAAASMLAADHAAKDAIVREVIEEWERYWKGMGFEGHAPIANDAERSIAMWYERGLPLATLKRFVDVTMSKFIGSRMSQYKIWRYYAGCCWSALNEIEAKAQQILAEEASPDAP